MFFLACKLYKLGLYITRYFKVRNFRKKKLSRAVKIAEYKELTFANDLSSVFEREQAFANG